MYVTDRHLTDSYFLLIQMQYYSSNCDYNIRFKTIFCSTQLEKFKRPFHRNPCAVSYKVCCEHLAFLSRGLNSWSVATILIKNAYNIRLYSKTKSSANAERRRIHSKCSFKVIDLFVINSNCESISHQFADTVHGVKAEHCQLVLSSGVASMEQMEQLLPQE